MFFQADNGYLNQIKCSIFLLGAKLHAQWLLKKSICISYLNKTLKALLYFSLLGNNLHSKL